MIKVIIADDHEILKEGIKTILENDPEIQVIAFAKNGQDALNLCEIYNPDLVLMDIIMPEIDGVEGTNLIKKSYPHIKVIILTTFNDDKNISMALKNGADGYLLKDVPPEDLILSVKAAYKGIRILHKNTFKNVIKKLDSNGISIIKKEASIELTNREKEILQLISEGKNNKDMARELFICEGSVRNAVSKLLKKLEIKDRIGLAVYAAKNGLIP